jgi:hypothetical protein
VFYVSAHDYRQLCLRLPKRLFVSLRKEAAPLELRIACQDCTEKMHFVVKKVVRQSDRRENDWLCSEVKHSERKYGLKINEQRLKGGHHIGRVYLVS